jgi:hypothetical protein
MRPGFESRRVHDHRDRRQRLRHVLIDVEDDSRRVSAIDLRPLPPFCETGCLDAMALRYFNSGRFLEVLNSHWLPLKEGSVQWEIGLSPQGVKSLSYTVDLTRLDK